LSKCRYCGAEIVWAKRDNGGWYPPYEGIEPLDLKLAPDQILLAPSAGTYIKIFHPENLVVVKVHNCPQREQASPTKREVLLGPELAARLKAAQTSVVKIGPDIPPYWLRGGRLFWYRNWKTPTRLQVMQVPCEACDARIGEPCVSKMIKTSRQYLTAPHWQRSKAVKEWAVTHADKAVREDLQDQAKAQALASFFAGPGAELFGVAPSLPAKEEPSGAPDEPLSDAGVQANSSAVFPVPDGVETAERESGSGEGDDEWWKDLLGT
jgi:hypothetical protein